MEQHADEALRKATLPATPADYKIELPADFKPPAGVEMKLNPADPAFEAARNWAHAQGIDQAAFSELIGVYGAHQAREHATIQAAAAAEVAKDGRQRPAAG